jgi:hypothetical protein
VQQLADAPANNSQGVGNANGDTVNTVNTQHVNGRQKSSQKKLPVYTTKPDILLSAFELSRREERRAQRKQLGQLALTGVAGNAAGDTSKTTDGDTSKTDKETKAAAAVSKDSLHSGSTSTPPTTDTEGVLMGTAVTASASTAGTHGEPVVGLPVE